jgi:hypothetical protein
LMDSTFGETNPSEDEAVDIDIVWPTPRLLTQCLLCLSPQHPFPQVGAPSLPKKWSMTPITFWALLYINGSWRGLYTNEHAQPCTIIHNHTHIYIILNNMHIIYTMYTYIYIIIENIIKSLENPITSPWKPYSSWFDPSCHRLARPDLSPSQDQVPWPWRTCGGTSFHMQLELETAVT